MSTHAMSWALRQDLEDHLLARLLAVLGDFANTSAVAWPSVATLAERVHASARTVQRRLAQLARLGLISVAKQHDRHGRQRSNLYRLNLFRARVTGATACRRSPHRNRSLSLR